MVPMITVFVLFNVLLAAFKGAQDCDRKIVQNLSLYEPLFL